MAKLRLNANTETFETMSLFDKDVLFSNYRIDRKTVPEGIYMYELRDDSSDGIPCEIAEGIAVDFFGTVLSKEPIELTEDGGKRRYIKYKDYGWDGPGLLTLKEWMENDIHSKEK